jgi:hypothetical protein
MVDDGQFYSITSELRGRLQQAEYDLRAMQERLTSQLNQQRQQYEVKINKIETRFLNDISRVEKQLEKQIDQARKLVESQLEKIQTDIKNKELNQQQIAKKIQKEVQKRLEIIAKENLIPFDVGNQRQILSGFLANIDTYLVSAPQAAIGIAENTLLNANILYQQLLTLKLIWTKQHNENLETLNQLKEEIRKLKDFKVKYTRLNEDEFDASIDVNFWVEGKLKKIENLVPLYEEQLLMPYVPIEDLIISLNGMTKSLQEMETFASQASTASLASLKRFEYANVLLTEMNENTGLFYSSSESGFLGNLGEFDSEGMQFHNTDIQLVFYATSGKRISITVGDSSLSFDFGEDRKELDNYNHLEGNHYLSLLNQQLTKFNKVNYHYEVTRKEVRTNGKISSDQMKIKRGIKP